MGIDLEEAKQQIIQGFELTEAISLILNGKDSRVVFLTLAHLTSFLIFDTVKEESKDIVFEEFKKVVNINLKIMGERKNEGK